MCCVGAAVGAVGARPFLFYFACGAQRSISFLSLPPLFYSWIDHRQPKIGNLELKCWKSLQLRHANPCAHILAQVASRCGGLSNILDPPCGCQHESSHTMHCRSGLPIGARVDPERAPVDPAGTQRPSGHIRAQLSSGVSWLVLNRTTPPQHLP